MEKTPKKWSIGNILFRKNKKDIPQADFSSDEDDRKAGFTNEFNSTKKTPTKVKSNKQLVDNFDRQQYTVANPEFHYFKPTIQQQQLSQHQRPQNYSNQTNLDSINNQINIEKNRLGQQQYIFSNGSYHQYQGSSQDEKSSYNSLSSPINKDGSENGSRCSLNNKKSRTARNERYYQRISRDERPQTVYGSVNSMENYKYQPIINGDPNRLSTSMKSASLCSSEFMNPSSHSLPIPRYNPVHSDNKDDYENIHEVDQLPPPIPPRDPNRRFSINSTSLSQNYPYYFDNSLQKYVIFNTNGKCFSDDKLWKHDKDLNRYTNSRSMNSNKYDKSECNGSKNHDILKPRSRKPLHLNTNIDNETVFSSEDVVDNPRVHVHKDKRSQSALDFPKMMNEQPNRIKVTPLRHRNLTSIEPIRYKPVETRNESFCSDELQALRQKYSSADDVTNKKVIAKPNAKVSTAIQSRNSFNPPEMKRKDGNISSNLDEAINELELMYKSLIRDDGTIGRVEKRDLPTPSKFSLLMRNYEEYENEENINDKEPDIVKDDVFSRNLKHANQMLKVHERQPPFGIPNPNLCPIPPKPANDYLSVEPIQTRKSLIASQCNPDVIADDLAVRNLRKDNPNYSSRRNQYIEVDKNNFMKRNHTISSLSDHIFNGILKDAAKPNGGNLQDYLQLEPLKKQDDKNDVKSTLYLVNKEQTASKADREDFENSLNALVIESKAISEKLEKDLSKLKRESVTPTQRTMVNILDFRKSMEKDKQCSVVVPVPQSSKPKMVTTGCSPIKDFNVSPSEEINKSPKHQKAEKIGNLIKMFNTSTEELKKTPTKNIEKPPRKLSDISGMFSKTPESEIASPIHAPKLGRTKKSFSIDEREMTHHAVESPEIIRPDTEPKVQVDVESNIFNIKQLIQQIKETEFENKNKNLTLKPNVEDLPDYDNIQDDYEMSDGKLVNKNPKQSEETYRACNNSSDVKAMTTTSPHKTVAETSPKEYVKNEEKINESAAIYKDAMEFLNDNSDVKKVDESHKSPIQKTLRQNKEVVLNYIDQINENLGAVRKSDEYEEQKMNVKQNVYKMERKMSLSRQNSGSCSPLQVVETAPREMPQSPIAIKPVVLPKINPSDTESLYNSTEELSMIFGIGEQNVKVPQPGNLEDEIDAEFEKIAHDENILDDKVLNDSFNVTLIDLNNNLPDNIYTECFDNELSEDFVNKSSSASADSTTIYDSCIPSSSSSSSAAANHFLLTSNDDNNNNISSSMNVNFTATMLELEKKLIDATAKYNCNENKNNTCSNNNIINTNNRGISNNLMSSHNNYYDGKSNNNIELQLQNNGMTPLSPSTIIAASSATNASTKPMCSYVKYLNRTDNKFRNNYNNDNNLSVSNNDRETVPSTTSYTHPEHHTTHNLISASLAAPLKRDCDENNNNAINKKDNELSLPSKTPESQPPAPPAPPASTSSTDESQEKDSDDEKLKPKQMVGLFPMDLRSELKNRIGGGNVGLKKSSTNVDIFNNRKPALNIPKLARVSPMKPSDLLKSIKEKQLQRKESDGNSNEENAQENLTFKEKLKLIERSSSKSLVNPLTQSLLVKSKSYSVVQQTDVDRSILQNRLKLLNEPEKTDSGTSIDQTSSDDDNVKMRPEESISKNGSIAERLALLKNNGENNWRKRVTKKETNDDVKRDSFVSDVLSSVATKENEFPKPALRQVKSVEGGKISDRLEQIKNDSQKWKNRVEPTDAANFKILNNSEDDPPELPFTKSETKKYPPMEVFKSEKIQSYKLSKSTSTTFGASSSSKAITTKSERKVFSRSFSVQETDNLDSAPVTKGQLKVRVPILDNDGFKSFFPKIMESNDEDYSVDITDFDEIKTETVKLSYKKVAGPKRRRPVTNPVKSLAHLRTDITEYTQLVHDETTSPTEVSDKKSKFTAEALAGLASVEDFTSVSLKSSADPLNLIYLPFKSPMLMHIKGRRHVQIRLVAPTFSSLNNGDCFIFVTDSKLFNFIGRYANVIEMKCTKDICMQIIRDKDLGCSANANVMINDSNLDGYNGKVFCNYLQRQEDEKLANAGHADEDELIELCLQETNKIYEFVEDSLVPVKEFWGQLPTIAVIDPKKILIFDFGSEFYVWYGRSCLPDAKKIALLLAEELYALPYDYKMCNVSPLNYVTMCGHRITKNDLNRSGKRSSWGLFAKINQNMETALFREKFMDWPDIKIHTKREHFVDCNEIDQINGGWLYRSHEYEEPNLYLENSNLGRGTFYYDMDTRRHFDVISISVTKWHATESTENQEVQPDVQQHFYANESYTVRWIYQISITVRELSGKVSNRSTVGRDRCVYFNWQGVDASASEKGIATLHMVELDKEKGSQMVLQQYSEIPAFVRLFQVIFVHKKRQDEMRFSEWRMYLIHGNDVCESMVYEVSCGFKQLRSRACLLLVHGDKGILILWNGCKVSKQQKEIALNVCKKIQSENSSELYPGDNIKFTDVNEGEEDAQFFDFINGQQDDRLVYGSLLEKKEVYNFTPRMYEFTSKNGSFEAIEVVSSLRTKDFETVFPFVQDDLYNARQPTLFLIDNGYCLYLWQGWWPKVEENVDTVDTNAVENRAGENRWHLEKTEAMQTAVDYWKAKCGDDEELKKNAFFVTAGYEPIEFQTIFIEWTVREDVVEHNSQNATTALITLEEYLSRFQQTEYPLEVLLARPLPETVNSTQLEKYLNADDFEQALGMSKEDFKKLPLWKRTNLKKENGLF